MRRRVADRNNGGTAINTAHGVDPDVGDDDPTGNDGDGDDDWGYAPVHIDITAIDGTGYVVVRRADYDRLADVINNDNDTSYDDLYWAARGVVHGDVRSTV